MIIKVQGEDVLIDQTDYGLVSPFEWKLQKGRATKYAYSNIKRSRIRMHRLIMDVTNSKIQVDHEDGNGLNNQRANLRICNNSQNNANKLKKKLGRKSKYLGVTLNYYTSKRTGIKTAMWRALAGKDGKVIYIGSFKTEIEAAKAYNKKALELHGEFAMLNGV